MTDPKLRRIKLSSLDQLHTWLSKNTRQTQGVMFVTGDKTSTRHHISSAEVRAVLSEFGWIPGPSATLGGGLLGHVARPAQPLPETRPSAH